MQEIIASDGLIGYIKSRLETRRHNMGKYKIAVLPGDGIGPEVIEQALR